MSKELYLISDLHFGGDGGLQSCDFTNEIIEFLRDLARKKGEIELVIAGDTFGFWELTTIEGVAQLDEIINHHREIFEQFKRTGAQIEITMMVGNHDYDLACDAVYAEKLRAYNINLDTSLSLVRAIGTRKIWIEHGQQIDPFNRVPAWGDRFALPAGFFITQSVVAGASRYSIFGARDWLKDVRSVDVRSLFDWLASNYFYNEMNFVLRWLLLPFSLLLTVTIAALAAELLRVAGVFDANILLDNRFVRALGLVGDAVRWILTASMFVWLLALLASAPLYFVYRDIKRTLRRFQIPMNFKTPQSDEANRVYLDHAREIFKSDSDICAYVFGHTHDAFLVEDAGRAIINTGTWLKILRRVPVRFGVLPAVYYPTFRLNYFRIFEENQRLTIDYVEVPKQPVQELTLLQRLLIAGRKPIGGKPIPARTIL